MTKLVPTKRIPTADDEVLRESLSFIHDKVHTPDGLHDFDQPRATLIQHGQKAQKITSELRSRHVGYQNPCRFCSGNLGEQFH